MESWIGSKTVWRVGLDPKGMETLGWIKRYEELGWIKRYGKFDTLGWSKGESWVDQKV